MVLGRQRKIQSRKVQFFVQEYRLEFFRCPAVVWTIFCCDDKHQTSLLILFKKLKGVGGFWGLVFLYVWAVMSSRAGWTVKFTVKTSDINLSYCILMRPQ